MVRLRSRMVVRPLLLVILLFGIAAVRAVEGFPQETLSSLHRVITHPGRYLEDAAYTMEEDLAMRQSLKGKRWWRNAASHSALEGQFPAQGHADLPSRFSDSGGFLQLCLLLMFCLAVICCASVSITPWYNLDRVFVKRCIAGIWVAFALVLDMLLAKLAMSPSSKQDGTLKFDMHPQGFENTKLSGQAPQRGAKKAAKGKKRRGTYGGGPPASNPTAPAARPAEENLSLASEESCATDAEPVAAPPMTEVEPSPRTYVTPADAQIARIEAEALEKQMQRLAKQKKQAQQPKVEEPSQQSVAPESMPASQKASQSSKPNASGPGSLVTKLQPGKQEPQPRHAESHSAAKSQSQNPAERKQGVEVHVRAFPRKPRDSYHRGQDHSRSNESEQKERSQRRPHTERSSGSNDKVLLVPRRSLYNKHKPAEVQHAAEESSEKQLAPQTPDRAAIQNTRSPLNSPQSLASPSRPYAEVAKPRFGPPPPPPPRRQLSALPKSAVYAQEFTPAAYRTPVAAPAEPQFGEGVPLQMGVHDLTAFSRASAPPSLEIPGASEYSGAMTTTSPFPGMSTHRKRGGLPVTGLYSNVLPNQLPAEFGGTLSSYTSRAPSSTESDPSPAFLARPTSPWPSEHGFTGIPGILDSIWGNRTFSRSEATCSPWSGNLELVSDVSLASSSELGSSMFGHLDPPLLTLGHGSF